MTISPIQNCSSVLLDLVKTVTKSYLQPFLSYFKFGNCDHSHSFYCSVCSHSGYLQIIHYFPFFKVKTLEWLIVDHPTVALHGHRMRIWELILCTILKFMRKLTVLLIISLYQILLTFFERNWQMECD